MGIKLGRGGSGGAGALAVNNNHIFATTTARNTYFASNPSEVVQDMYISVSGVLQKRVGAAWVDTSAIIKGADGADAQTPIVNYSIDGLSGWTSALNPAIHKYWRWSTNNGIIWTPAVKFAAEEGAGTGDQTSISGITGTKSQFNTSVTDGDFLFAGEALTSANNLSDLASASTARTNLGLGTLATQSGTFSGTSSGTNTGDQTSIVGITGTKAQFDTAVTDGNFLFSGDVTQYTDEMAQDAVGAMVDSTLTYTDGTPLLSRAALTGEATASAGSNSVTLTNSAVIAKVLTGYTSGTGTVAATDTILQAIQKLNGNDAATLTAAQAYADGLVTGLLDLKGGADVSTNPNYPAALKGDTYYVTVAGKIGGASGTLVDVGDMYIASADNAGGTQASVGSSWFVIEHNLVGALFASNNLSDLTSAPTARTNLGLGTLATQSGTFSGTSSGTNTGDQTITLTGAITGSGTGSFATSVAAQTGTGSTFAMQVAPNLTGFVGINNVSAGASLDVGALSYTPGTVSVTGTTVTGTSTEFTKTFKVGDSITTTTGSGSETKEIQTISSDTAITTVAAFAGTNTGASYSSSNTGSQFSILPSGCIRLGNTSGLSSNNVHNTVYKSDTVNVTGSQVFSTIKDQTTYNQNTTASGTINSYSAGIRINATGAGSFGSVRGINAFPTVSGTNTGDINTIQGVLSANTVVAGATGTISNIVGVNVIGTNSSTTNTVTNQWGVSVSPTQAAGTLTNYAGVAVAAKPTAATNSSLLLIGTTVIPTGDFAIYNASTSSNYIEGNTGFGIAPTTSTIVLASKNITGAHYAQAFRTGSVVQSDVTNEARGFISLLGTAATSFNLSNLRHFYAGQGTFGAGSAVTNQYGFHADSNLIGATNNYGFHGNIPAGTGRYNLYMNGTADNYMAGALGIGAFAAAGYNLDVFGTSAKIRVRDSGQAGGLEIYQQSSDGGSRVFAANNNYLAFGTDNTERMRISASGDVTTTGLEYNTSKSVSATSSLTAAAPTKRRTYFTGAAGASFAVTLPSAAVSIDGALITLMSTETRAATTWVSAGATFEGAPSSLTANVPVTFQYHHATRQWFITE